MHPELDRAMKSVLEASRNLAWWRNRPAKALEIITPFHNLAMPAGVDRGKYEIVMGLVMAVTGDCCFAMKEPLKAAQWYQRATQYRKGGPFAPRYADLVLRHDLSDHYQSSLECLEASRASWSRQPLWVKILSHLLSKWWLHPHQWRLALIGHTLRRRLQERIEMGRNE
jgi:hypothetical protein